MPASVCGNEIVLFAHPEILLGLGLARVAPKVAAGAWRARIRPVRSGAAVRPSVASIA